MERDALTQQKKKEKLLTSDKKTKESEEREKTIWKVRKYLTSERFGKYLTKELGITYTHKQLQKLKLGTLQNVLSRIRVAVNNKNTDKILNSFVFSMSITTEKVVSPFYDIDGFTHNLQQSESFMNALECWKIEQEVPSLNPTAQLCLVASQVALMTHEVNKRQVPQKTMTPPDENEVKKLLEETEKKPNERRQMRIGETR